MEYIDGITHVSLEKAKQMFKHKCCVGTGLSYVFVQSEKRWIFVRMIYNRGGLVPVRFEDRTFEGVIRNEPYKHMECSQIFSAPDLNDLKKKFTLQEYEKIWKKHAVVIIDRTTGNDRTEVLADILAKIIIANKISEDSMLNGDSTSSKEAKGLMQAPRATKKPSKQKS